ncbi:MAG: GTP 3',8-cyclase MoaA [Candidatus Omnitrophica bacterium]|nr:GTP 3',8-cyclase MoaA [Candidatus Omnitrophota bacterium]
MLVDAYNRKIDYLRISVTDRCNLRCIYCMPETGIINKPHEELLSFEEIVEIVKAAVELGIDKIRLTGGEPLVRKGLVNLISSLNKIEGIKDISLTTNGILLKEYAFSLKEAGLKRLNISLNSLKPERYRSITRKGRLEDVLEAIKVSLRAGFSPLKTNFLLLSGINEDEILDFLRITLENPLCVRFLEFMPVNSFYQQKDSILAGKILEIAKRFGEIEETEVFGFGPAKTFKFKNALGSFGIISPLSDKFCGNCNRLRLTSDGFLKVCLHSDIGVNLKGSLRRGVNQREIINLIRRAVYLKPKEHSLDRKGIQTQEEFSMCQIGG